MCDAIDSRHKAILPEHVRGDGNPGGVNKRAAEEMKNRIIEKLTELSAGKDGELEKKLKADGVSGDIPKKAGASLKEILHRYSNFSVQTIDSFFHRVIRSFAKELKLQLGYGIEVEIDDVLNVVVDKMLDRIARTKSSRTTSRASSSTPSTTINRGKLTG